MLCMGLPVHRLLCTWHVDRAWRWNLSRVDDDSPLKVTNLQDNAFVTGNHWSRGFCWEIGSLVATLERNMQVGQNCGHTVIVWASRCTTTCTLRSCIEFSNMSSCIGAKLDVNARLAPALGIRICHKKGMCCEPGRVNVIEACRWALKRSEII